MWTFILEGIVDIHWILETWQHPNGSLVKFIVLIPTILSHTKNLTQWICCRTIKVIKLNRVSWLRWYPWKMLFTKDVNFLENILVQKVMLDTRQHPNDSLVKVTVLIPTIITSHTKNLTKWICCKTIKVIKLKRVSWLRWYRWKMLFT